MTASLDSLAEFYTNFVLVCFLFLGTIGSKSESFAF